MTNTEYLRSVVEANSPEVFRRALEAIDAGPVINRLEAEGVLSQQEHDSLSAEAEQTNWFDYFAFEAPMEIMTRCLLLLNEDDREDVCEVPVGAAIDSAFEGFVDLNEGGGEVIVLNWGIVQFADLTVKAVLALGTIDTETPWSTSFDKRTLLNTFYRLGRSMHDRHSWLGGVKTRFVPDRPQGFIVDLYIRVFQDFVLLHEIYHVLEQHFQRRNDWDFEMLEPSVRLESLRNWEFEADDFAVDRLLAPENEVPPSAVAAGAAVMFGLLDLGEHCFPNMDKPTDRDHPPACERWLRQRSKLVRDDRAESLVQLIENTFEYVKRNFPRHAIPPIEADLQKSGLQFRK